MKLETDWSETTTCADAIAFCWSSRQMCSSWTDSMPGIWVAGCFSGLPETNNIYPDSRHRTYLFKVMLHVLDLDTPWGTFEQDGPRVPG